MIKELFLMLNMLCSLISFIGYFITLKEQLMFLAIWFLLLAIFIKGDLNEC